MRTDCVGFTSESAGCRCLRYLVCKDNDECKFYKTKEMLRQQEEKIRERIPKYTIDGSYFKEGIDYDWE